MAIETALIEYQSARKECEATMGPDHQAAKERLSEAFDRVAETSSDTADELFAKIAVLRDAIPFRGNRREDLLPYRLLASVRKDVERLIAISRF